MFYMWVLRSQGESYSLKHTLFFVILLLVDAVAAVLVLFHTSEIHVHLPTLAIRSKIRRYLMKYVAYDWVRRVMTVDGLFLLRLFL